MKSLDLLEKEGLSFIEVKSGKFLMGHISDDIYSQYMEEQREVEITSSFYILKTPVTVKQYRKYTEELNIDTSYLIDKWDGNDWVTGPYFDEINNDGDFPVVGVSYYDSISYIKWLSEKYHINFRLPTEAEFEFAAKGGCNCKGKCKCAEMARIMGLDRPEDEVPRKKSFSIDKMVKNDLGLLGMHCSVWQWCSDWYYYYNSDDVIDPTGPILEPPFAPWKHEKWKSGKVIRGGSFSYPFYHSRCSDRHYSLVTDRNYNVGFRVVFDSEELEK